MRESHPNGIQAAEFATSTTSSTATTYPRALNADVRAAPSTESGESDARFADLARRLETLTAAVDALRGNRSAPETGIASEFQAMRAQIAAMAVTQEALAKKAGLPPPWPSDPVEVEKIRDRWRSTLADAEKKLWASYPKGPDPRGDIVAWSEFDEHRKAQAAFEAASDSAALRALSEGEFHYYFTVKR